MPVNSVICEQKFSNSNNYTNCKAMNGPRFNFFWIYIFDLNNLKSVGKVRTLANPLSKKRLEVILEEKLESLVKNRNDEKDEDLTADVDDVSILYYESEKDDQTCSCTRKAKCQTSKCACFKNNVKCKPFCHPELSSNCTNNHK